MNTTTVRFAMWARLTGLACSACVLAGSSSSSAVLPKCVGSPHVQYRVAPGYPSPKQALAYHVIGTTYLHLFVAGTLWLKIVLLPNGKVAYVHVVKSALQPVGRGAEQFPPGHFAGFLNPNVLDAVRQWRFSPVRATCSDQVAITFRATD